MKRNFLTLIITLMCVFLFSVFASAETYTVSSNDEYEEAYEKAVSGDTIIIDTKLTCDIQATKSVTYILKADWESASFVHNSNVTVSFVADGGNYRILPTNYSTTNGWFNVTTALENVVINLMGINGGTVTLDGLNATHDRVSYVTVSSDITWNFFDGSAIAHFNPTTKDSDNFACIVYSKNFNMYEGSEIYANNIVSAPLIKATNFNMHGGEIFGNLLTSTKNSQYSCGAIFVSNEFVMWDGKIHSNIFNAKAYLQINYIGFITLQKEKAAIMLGGELGLNYASGIGSNEVSAMFGTVNKDAQAYGYYTSNYTMGTRKLFTDGTIEMAYSEALGKTIWQITNPTISTTSENWSGYSFVHSKALCENTVSFFKINMINVGDTTFYELELADLFVIGLTATNGYGQTTQKNYTYSYSGASALTIPSGVSAWSIKIDEYCHSGKAMTIEEINASIPVVLYASYENPITEESGTTACSICKKEFTCENSEHEKKVTIEYSDFAENGTKMTRCIACNVVRSEEAPALFTCLGYSAQEYANGGIQIGFAVNHKAIKEYNATKEADISFGIFAVAQARAEGKEIINKDGTAIEGVASVDFSKHSYDIFAIRVVGFETSEQRDAQLALGAYVIDGGKVSYLQVGTPVEGQSYCYTSYNAQVQ